MRDRATGIGVWTVELAEWREQNPDRPLDWSIVAQDHDNPGKYIAIVHFESFDVAMKNSADPRTADYAPSQ